MKPLSEEARWIAAVAHSLDAKALRELVATACRLAGRDVPLTFTDDESVNVWPDGRFGSARKLAFVRRRLDELRPRLQKAKEAARASVIELAHMTVITGEVAQRGAWNLSDLTRRLGEVADLEEQLESCDVDTRPPAEVIVLSERVTERNVKPRGDGPIRDRLRWVLDNMPDDDPPPTG